MLEPLGASGLVVGTTALADFAALDGVLGGDGEAGLFSDRAGEVVVMDVWDKGGHVWGAVLDLDHGDESPAELVGQVLLRVGDDDKGRVGGDVGLFVVDGGGHPKAETPADHERPGCKVEEVCKDVFPVVGDPLGDVRGGELGLVGEDLSWLAGADLFGTLTDSVGRVCNNPVKERLHAERWVRHVLPKDVDPLCVEVVLDHVCPDIALDDVAVGVPVDLAAHGPPAHVGAHDRGTKPGCGDKERACPDVGVKDQRAGPCVDLVGHEEGQLCVHRGGAQVGALLEVKLGHLCPPVCACDLAPDPDVLGGLGDLVGQPPPPVFKDPKRSVRLLELDLSVKEPGEHKPLVDLQHLRVAPGPPVAVHPEAVPHALPKPDVARVALVGACSSHSLRPHTLQLVHGLGRAPQLVHPPDPHTPRCHRQRALQVGKRHSHIRTVPNIKLAVVRNLHVEHRSNRVQLGKPELVKLGCKRDHSLKR